jgi:hypothetical protein
MNRCYICLDSTAPLVSCSQVPCAWAWHPHCQRQRDLGAPAAALGLWAPVVCESGHPQAGPTTQKRVRKQWTRCACACRVNGLGAVVGAAWATFWRWLWALLWTSVRLVLIRRLVDTGISILCTVCGMEAREEAAIHAWRNTVGWCFYLMAWWSIVVAAINFWDRVVACWRLRTVDYV